MFSRLNRNWVKWTVFVLVILTMLSCNFVESFFESEPPIDLAGEWYNSVTTTVTTIVWEDDEFRVVSMYDTEDQEDRPITFSEWDGTRITWSYYLESNGLTITYTMTSLVGDNLNCDWVNTNNATGTRTLTRR
ncbi:MAG TPA: hypothetical protein G4O08_07940 [Anaerolineae bacterium]|nr:hypothetical protein [Anaerolineae bacterium]